MQKEDDKVLVPMQMMESLYRVHQQIEHMATGTQLPGLTDIGDAEADAWQAAYSVLHKARESGGAVNVKALAAEFGSVLQRGSEAATWEMMPASTRWKWEALVRHYVNLQEIDLEEDRVETHEEKIALWWGAKVKETA